MNLTTVDRVLARIAADGDAKAATKTEIAAVIVAVSGAVEAYLERVTLRTARTEYHDVDRGQCRFRLRAYPVTVLTSVAFDTEQEWATALTAGTDYLSPLYDNGGTLVVRYPLSEYYESPGALKVVYTGGMATDTDSFVAAYPDIASAVDTQVSHEWQRRNALGVSSVSSPDGTTASLSFDRWIPSVKQVLDFHARR